MTAKQIFEEQLRLDNYWFRRTMDGVEETARINSRIYGSKKSEKHNNVKPCEGFSSEEIAYLNSLFDGID